jgi:hypothetical protein
MRRRCLNEVMAEGGSNMRVIRRGVVLLVFTLTLTAGGTVGTQKPVDPPAAPVPAPIFTAKKAFISNASGEIGLPAGTPDLTYNEFYAAMKNWGRYELVSAPGDADLVFEIRFTFVGGGSTQDFQFRAVIRDPKSSVVLWAFSESVRQSGSQATGRKYFDQAMTTLVDDLKSLAKAPTS